MSGFFESTKWCLGAIKDLAMEYPKTTAAITATFALAYAATVMTFSDWKYSDCANEHSTDQETRECWSTAYIGYPVLFGAIITIALTVAGCVAGSYCETHCNNGEPDVERPTLRGPK